MFAARCAGISLAVFVLLYVPLSLLVSRGWRFSLRMLKLRSPRSKADLLCVLRVLPFVVASVFTFVFTLPSFLLLEPRSTDEAVGTAPLILGFCCVLLLVIGIGKTASAQFKTRQALARWLDGSELMERCTSVPVFRTRQHAPSLTVAGVHDPKVLVSEDALAALTSAELHVALKHEMAHVRYYDNLKKLLFRLSSFPGMQELERTWSEETELAADDAAVSSSHEALDLASALIKVSRLNSVHAPVLTTGLLHSSTALGTRVKRLFSWQAEQPSRNYWWYALPPIAATLLFTVVTYGSTLNRLHDATEWLVR